MYVPPEGSKAWRATGWKRERGKKEGDVQGRTNGETGHLKFRRASGQGFGATLHWCSVATNKQSE